MAFYKVSISAYTREYYGENNGIVDFEQIDQDEIIFVEADSSTDAINIAKEIHEENFSDTHYGNIDATEITYGEIPSNDKLYTKREILISKIKKLERYISYEKEDLEHCKSELNDSNNFQEYWIRFIKSHENEIKELQLELEKAKQELKNLEESN